MLFVRARSKGRPSTARDTRPLSRERHSLGVHSCCRGLCSASLLQAIASVPVIDRVAAVRRGPLSPCGPSGTWPWCPRSRGSWNRRIWYICSPFVVVRAHHEECRVCVRVLSMFAASLARTTRHSRPCTVLALARARSNSCIDYVRSMQHNNIMHTKLFTTLQTPAPQPLIKRLEEEAAQAPGPGARARAALALAPSLGSRCGPASQGPRAGPGARASHPGQGIEIQR